MARHHIGVIVSPERAERVHQSLAMASDQLDRLSSDLESLCHAMESDRSSAALGEAEIGRLFLLVRDALATAALLQQQSELIAASAERAFYEGDNALPSLEHDAYSARLADWLEAEAESRRVAPQRRVA
jgi:hypothetical protein